MRKQDNMFDNRVVRMHGTHQIAFTDVNGVTIILRPNDSWEFSTYPDHHQASSRCRLMVCRNGDYNNPKCFILNRTEWLRLSKKIKRT